MACIIVVPVSNVISAVPERFRIKIGSEEVRIYSLGLVKFVFYKAGVTFGLTTFCNTCYALEFYAYACMKDLSLIQEKRRKPHNVVKFLQGSELVRG